MTLVTRREFEEEKALCDGNPGDVLEPRSFEDLSVIDKLDRCDRLSTILLHELLPATNTSWALSLKSR